MTDITLLILVFTLVVSIWAFSAPSLQQRLIFNAFIVHRDGQWYRLLTCGFIHGDWLHLIVNMMVFYSFGSQVELIYGSLFGEQALWYFIMLYFGGIVLSILPSYYKHRQDPGYNSLGASGGVAAIVFTSILFNPLQKIYLYGLIGLPGILMGCAYLVYSIYMSRRGGGNINHNAHLWGAVYGVVYTILLKPSILKIFMQGLFDF
jgi:membrane associated rhomboid family serine protease